MKPRKTALFAILLSMIVGCYFYYNRESPSAHFDQHIMDAIHLPTPNAFFEQADAYKYAQDYRRALAAFEKLLPQSKTAVDSLYTYNQLAYIALSMNEDSAAAKYIHDLEKHFPLVDKDTPSVAGDYFYNRGVLAYRVFHPKEAESLLKRALGLYEKVYGGEHLKVAMCLTELGMMHYELAITPDSAFIYLPLAYEVFRKNISFNKYSATCLLGMSHITYLKFENEKALDFIEKALLELNSKNDNFSELYSRCLSQKGNICQKIAFLENDSKLRLKYMTQADTLLKLALNLGKQNITLRLQEYLRNLIVFASKRKDTTLAKIYFDELSTVLKIQENHYGNIQRLKGYYFSQIGVVDSSIYCYNNYWEEHHLDTLNRFLLFEVTESLRILYLERNNFDSSLYFSKQNILLAATLYPSKDLSWNYILSPKVYKKNKYIFISYFLVIQTLNKKYEDFKDFQSLQLAFEISKLTDENLFQNIFSSEEESVLAYEKEYGEKSYSDALKTTFLLFKKTKERQYLEFAFRFSERLKSILLYRNIDDETNIHKPTNAILDSVRELNYKISQARWEKEYIGKETSNITELTNRLQKYYSEIEIYYPQYYKNKIQQVLPSISEVQKKLKTGQILLHYTLCPQKWYRIAVSPFNIDFQEFDSTELLINDIADFKLILKNDNQSLTISDYCKTAGKLHYKLLQGLKNQLSIANNLVIVPDRQLYGVPFEAFVGFDKNLKENNLTFKTAPYLVNSFAVDYTSSWKIFQNNIDINIPLKPNIAFFTYDYKTKELPYAVVEYEAIIKNFSKNINLFKGDSCTKTNFFTQLVNCDIIHLSLHASSDPSNQFNNKVYFKNYLKDTLYGFELLKINSNTKLIILSACETADGKIKAGEGAFSLSRYFQQCGVKNIIASFWKIDNATTSKLLANFYTHLANNLKPNEALQKAKINFLSNANNQIANPKYWAGLVNLR